MKQENELDVASADNYETEYLEQESHASQSLLAARRLVLTTYSQEFSKNITRFITAGTAGFLFMAGGLIIGTHQQKNFAKSSTPLTEYNSLQDSIEAIDSSRVELKQPLTHSIEQIAQRLATEQRNERARMHSRLTSLKYEINYLSARREETEILRTAVLYGFAISLLPGLLATKYIKDVYSARNRKNADMTALNSQKT